MNAVPAQERGQASGVRAIGTNAGQVLSIGVFFSLMLAGLAATLPRSMEAGLLAQHVPPAVAQQVAANAAGRQPVRRVPWLQPDGPADPARGAAGAAAGQAPRC